MTYRVGRDSKTAKPYLSAAQALAAVLALREPVCVWQNGKGGASTHWTLVLDTSMPNASRLPLAEYARNVLGRSARTAEPASTAKRLVRLERSLARYFNPR